MKKLLPWMLLTAVLLTACSSTEEKMVEEPKPESTTEYTMDNGPLDPKTLKLKEFNVTTTLAPCANEESPVQSDVLAWDYDSDGAMDAVAVAKCPTGDKRTYIVIGRATTRGWWSVLTIGGTEDKIELTGPCTEVKATLGSNIEGTLVCPIKRLDIAEEKMIAGNLTVFLNEEKELMYGFRAK